MPDPHNHREPSAEERFAQLVREKREALGWSQEELARRVSVDTGEPFHQTGITRIEKLGRGIRLGEAVVLARVLGIDLGPLARNLTDDFVEEKYILRAIAAAEKAKKDQDSTLFKVQEEMEAMTTRYVSIQNKIADTNETIENLRRTLAIVQRNSKGRSDGDR